MIDTGNIFYCCLSVVIVYAYTMTSPFGSLSKAYAILVPTSVHKSLHPPCCCADPVGACIVVSPPIDTVPMNCPPPVKVASNPQSQLFVAHSDMV